MSRAVTRREIAAGVATTMLAPSLAAKAMAQSSPQASYPAGQGIKFIVPFPAGGATDIVGRVAADRLGAIWRTPTIVENVPGAGTNLGNDRVAKGPTDGTLILIAAPPLVVNRYLFAQLTYDPERDFTPLALVARVPNLLCVRNDLPVSSVADLIAYAKANPGKLNCATAGIGTSVHLSSELFKRMAGVEMVNVHYRGSSPAINDLVAGSIDLIFDNIGAIINLARSGAVKPLAITTLARSPLAPDYPPVSDTVAGFETTSFAGITVRAGTGREICDIIERDTIALCREPAVIERFAGLGVETVGMGAAGFASWLSAERAKWGQLIADLKIRAE